MNENSSPKLEGSTMSHESEVGMPFHFLLYLKLNYPPPPMTVRATPCGSGGIFRNYGTSEQFGMR